jgi:hypothetical protein
MSTNYDQMEEIWGLAAIHSEYQINDRISYTVEEQTRLGTIIWVCAPTFASDQHLPTRYVIQPDKREESLDIVLSGNIVIGETHKQEERSNPILSDSEQAIIAMLASLSTPIFIRKDIDDDGQPFYVWHIGESTPERPFGVCVGVHRQFSGALKLAIEKAIKGIRE